MSIAELWNNIITYEIPVPDIMAWDWSSFLTIAGLVLISLACAHLEA
jgi:hypothetical protein